MVGARLGLGPPTSLIVAGSVSSDALAATAEGTPLVTATRVTKSATSFRIIMVATMTSTSLCSDSVTDTMV